MTKEEKELLLKDIYARLPYKICARQYYSIFEDDFIIEGIIGEQIYAAYNLKISMTYPVEKVKPYLRPLSSMTEEEKKELLTLLVGEDSISYFKVENNGIINTDENIQFGHNWQYHWLNFSNENISLYVDWLNKSMFDYRGLIPMGLALPAPEGMYN